MAVLNRGDQRTYMNLLIGDSSATNQQLTDARKNGLLDEWHNWVWEAFGPRLLVIPHTASSGFTVVDSGLTVLSGFRCECNRTDIAELLSVHYEGTTNTGTHGTMLDRVTLAELMRRRDKSTAEGTPTAAAWYRHESAGIPNVWRILVHPPVGSTAIYLSVIARREVTAYSSDSSTPDVTPGESRLIPRGAAAEALYKIGRGKRAKYVARLLPMKMKAALALKLESQRVAA